MQKYRYYQAKLLWEDLIQVVCPTSITYAVGVHLKKVSDTDTPKICPELKWLLETEGIFVLCEQFPRQI